MTETIFEKTLSEEYFEFLPHVPSTNMEEAGFMAYTAASQQGAIEMFWLHYGGAHRLSTFYTVYDLNTS